MTLNDKGKILDSQNGLEIQQQGWRQGSLFDPSNILAIPVYFDPDHEVLLIMTHSCSVVSIDFNRDPLIEVMVAKKLAKFNPRSIEAKGKNQRRLELGIISSEVDYKAIECDLNRRFMFKRDLLLKLQPMNYLIPGKEKDLSQWIARSYTRTALPDELVDHMKGGLLKLIENTLKKEVDGSLFYTETHEIYISYKKLEDSGIFVMRLLFVCSTQNIADRLGEDLITKLDPYLNPKSKDGLQINDLDIRPRNQILVTDYDGYERFSEWDYFTSLGEIDSGRNFA